jgi:hypothetical protein
MAGLFPKGLAANSLTPSMTIITEIIICFVDSCIQYTA